MEDVKTLVDGIQEELVRCRQLLIDYDELPLESKWFAVAHIKADIERTERAMLGGDIVELLRCYEVLKDKK